MNLPPFFSKRAKMIAAIVSVALLALLFSQINLGELAGALSRADARLVLAALALETFNLGLRTFRWKVLLDEKSRIALKKLLPIQCAGLALSNFSPGKLADPVKVVFLKPLGVRYSFSLLTVVWERIFDLFLLFSASLLVLSIISNELAYAAFAAAILLALAALAVHKKLPALIRFFSKFKVFSFLKRVEAHKFKRITLAKAAALTLAIWGIDFFAAWLAFASLGVSLDYVFLAGAFSAAVVIGVFTFLPAGLGTTEFSLLFLLSLSGLPQAQLMAGIVLSRAVTLVYSSLVGLGLLPFAKQTGGAKPAAVKKRRPDRG